MKHSLRALLIGTAALTFPHVASASVVLAGWHDFTGDATSETPDVSATGFNTSTVNKDGINSFNYSGSYDGAYGGKDAGLDQPGAAPPYDGGDTNPVGNGNLDGSLLLQASKTIIFHLDNQSGTTYILESLLFDSATTASITGAIGKIEYRINAAAYQGLLTDHEYNSSDMGYTDITGSGTGFPALGEFRPGVKSYGNGGASTRVADVNNVKNSNDYSDFDFLLNMILPTGSTIDFKMTLVSGADLRVDNVAISGFTPVPEPGSLLALGCVIGSGAFLRMRRRS